GDPDLLMHYVACRAAGIVVRGPPPAELVGEVARIDVLGDLEVELRWALDDAPEAYGVLNACRALARAAGCAIRVAGAYHQSRPSATSR
ncbi:MAG: hypothetical protein ACRD0W_24125, partial [Acidimicrobiales bacterium]